MAPRFCSGLDIPMLDLMRETLSAPYRVTRPYPRWGEEITLEAEDGPPTILRVLAPASPRTASAGLLLVHGMNEYVGRYGAIARHFAERRLVAGFDLPAHGLSNPVLREADRAIRRGAVAYDIGAAYLAQTGLNSLEPFRRGLERALRRVIAILDHGRGAGTPVFILAHSLGALVAASYLLDPASCSRVSGIVLLGPAFSVPEPPGWRGWLANPLIRLSFTAEQRLVSPGAELNFWQRNSAKLVSRFLSGLFGGLSRPGLPGLVAPRTPAWVPNYLTDCEEERRRHRDDAYIIRRSLLSYVKAVEREIAAFRCRMAEFSLPYLLVYSGRDPITAPWGGRDFAALTRHRHPASEVLCLEDRYHHEHLFASPAETGAVLEHIDRWLTKMEALHRDGR